MPRCGVDMEMTVFLGLSRLAMRRPLANREKLSELQLRPYLVWDLLNRGEGRIPADSERAERT